MCMNMHWLSGSLTRLGHTLSFLCHSDCQMYAFYAYYSKKQEAGYTYNASWYTSLSMRDFNFFEAKWTKWRTCLKLDYWKSLLIDLPLCMYSKYRQRWQRRSPLISDGSLLSYCFSYSTWILTWFSNLSCLTFITKSRKPLAEVRVFAFYRY